MSRLKPECCPAAIDVTPDSGGTGFWCATVHAAPPPGHIQSHLVVYDRYASDGPSAVGVFTGGVGVGVRVVDGPADDGGAERGSDREHPDRATIITRHTANTVPRLFIPSWCAHGTRSTIDST
ncbi:hypothetical protein Lfu02_07710 [Longispora fulva]|nr:hypothetical protein Lfu02_07710 [Longispora fulva]